jgi:hypothetical protein
MRACTYKCVLKHFSWFCGLSNTQTHEIHVPPTLWQTRLLMTEPTHTCTCVYTHTHTQIHVLSTRILSYIICVILPRASILYTSPPSMPIARARRGSSSESLVKSTSDNAGGVSAGSCCCCCMCECVCVSECECTCEVVSHGARSLEENHTHTHTHISARTGLMRSPLCSPPSTTLASPRVVTGVTAAGNA